MEATNLSQSRSQSLALELVALDESGNDEIDQLAQLYREAKDENELLEFKNYELLFKIQELEQRQKVVKRLADFEEVSWSGDIRERAKQIEFM